jgi:exodeoxyribonuclease VII large subunit
MVRGDKGMPLFERVEGYQPEPAPERAKRTRARRAASPPAGGPPDDSVSEPEAAPAGHAGDRDRPLSVSAAIRAAQRVLEDGVGAIWIEGEVDEIKRPVSGHVYFTLKDEASSIAAVMWRADALRLRFALADGQRVLARGRLGIFERAGRFQLYVSAAEPVGAGAEALALAELRRRLAAEGLFDAARKRPLPPLPRRIGVVTSRTGAAIRDIVRVVHRRCPVPILVADAQVQGAQAVDQICRALAALARHPVDLVIVGRGGGSAADLAAFNDERVVRAIAACPVPTIAAIGHEVDVSLADLAADHRAATPSQAGELAVPVRAALEAALAEEERRLGRELGLRLAAARQELDAALERGEARVRDGLARARQRLAALDRQLAMRHPQARIARDRDALRQLEARAADAAHRRLDRAAGELGALATRLDALSPLRVLDRGYALTTCGERVVRAARDVAIGDAIELRLGVGRLGCRVETIDEDEGGHG